jgi:hypothetical protein
MMNVSGVEWSGVICIVERTGSIIFLIRVMKHVRVHIGCPGYAVDVKADVDGIVEDDGGWKCSGEKRRRRRRRRRNERKVRSEDSHVGLL